MVHYLLGTLHISHDTYIALYRIYHRQCFDPDFYKLILNSYNIFHNHTTTQKGNCISKRCVCIGVNIKYRTILLLLKVGLRDIKCLHLKHTRMSFNIYVCAVYIWYPFMYTCHIYIDIYFICIHRYKCYISSA